MKHKLRRKLNRACNSCWSRQACEHQTWNHCTSTPHLSETDGIAEGAVRRIREGTSAIRLQSGLDENCEADSMECYYLRNIQGKLCDGKTPCERRFGEPPEGPIDPFGSLVEYHPKIHKRPVQNPSIWQENTP